MSQEQWFVVGVIAFIIVFFIGSKIYRNMQLKNNVRQAFNKFPRIVGNRDTEKSLQSALKETQKHQAGDAYIDDLTWNDLDLFAVYQMVNLTFSSVGSERLYNRMRSYRFNENFKDLEAMIAFFEKNPQLKETVSYRFAQLGKKDNNYVANYLAQPKNQKLANPYQFLLMGLVPIIGLFLSFFALGAGILLMIAGAGINTVYYFKQKSAMEIELNSMSYLVQMFIAAKKIAKVQQPTQEEIKKNLRPLEKITKFASSFAVRTNSDGEMFMEYLNMIFLLPFISYNFVLRVLANHQEEAQNLWNVLGDLESALAILNFRQVMPYTTQPKFTKEMQVQGEDLYHPLLKEPVVNDVTWLKNTLVTGSNASGKSTYVKSVAISSVLSQTIHTALAEKFSLPHSLVITSMALEDNIFAGESYFIAEIKSVKRIIDFVSQDVPCLCFVDEILKGTNTIERIAASSSIVGWLQGQKALAFVATHDIELTEILKEQCANVHFAEQVNKKGVSFDYKLKAGPSKTRNALALLSVMDYPKDIVDLAKTQAQHFESARFWSLYPQTKEE